jgi:hypothetical protein
LLTTFTFSQQFAVGQTPVFLLKAGANTNSTAIKSKPAQFPVLNKTASITIYNLQGKKIATVHKITSPLNLPIGLYLAQVNGQGQIKTVSLKLIFRR